jgi:hypothetical protein
MSLNLSKPDITSPDKNREWYQQNAQYIASKYNRNPQVILDLSDEILLSPVDEAMRMYSYYLGRQSNNDYAYTNQKADGTQHTKWIGGQKLATMVDYMLGVSSKLIDSFKVNIEATSKIAYNRKTSIMEQAELKHKFQNEFADLDKLGISFDPTNGVPVNTPEELGEFGENYIDEAEEKAYILGEDIRLRNDYDSLSKEAMFHVIMGGVVGIKHDIINNKQWQTVIPLYDLIWDNSENRSVHKNDQFAGQLVYFTPDEFLKEYCNELTSVEIEEIEKINNENYNQFVPNEGNPGGFKWVKLRNNQPMLVGVQVYWKGLKDLGYKKTKDKYGNMHMRKSDEGEYKTTTVYKCLYVAGKYLVNYGENYDIVRNINDKGEAELPIKIFSPNIALGAIRSYASRLHQHQDRLDFYANEIIKKVHDAKGKKFVINKNKLGSSTSKQILSDFESMGFHVGDGAQDGEGNSGERLVDVVDMTLDPNITVLLSLKQEEERMMEEIINASKIALGQQAGYVGAKTQAASITQSSYGTLNFYTSFIDYCELNMQYAINQSKIALINESENEIPLIGTDGIRYMKVTKDFVFEDYRVYIRVIDMITEEAKGRLLSIALAFTQNGMLDPIDYLELERAKTYSDLIKHFTKSMKKKDIERKQQEAQAQMMAAAQQEQSNQSNIQQRGMAEEGQNYRKELEVGGKMLAQNPQAE